MQGRRKEPGVSHEFFVRSQFFIDNVLQNNWKRIYKMPNFLPLVVKIIVKGRFCNTLNWIPLVIWPRLFQKNPIQSNCQGSRLKITPTWSISWHSFVLSQNVRSGLPWSCFHWSNNTLNTKHTWGEAVLVNSLMRWLATSILKILNKIFLSRPVEAKQSS